jgi:ribosomal protein S18 acetylase RimI-like enzyme
LEIIAIDADLGARLHDRLVAILACCIEGGALVGFVVPFTDEQLDNYWRGVLASVAKGGRSLLGAILDGEIIGTVQLYLSQEPNAPHRAEIYKLLVHSDFRGLGVGEQLMCAIEGEASRHKRSLLLLDTALGGAAERLYRRLGWQEIGTVPRHFVDPFGALASSVYFMKFID